MLFFVVRMEVSDFPLLRFIKELTIEIKDAPDRFFQFIDIKN